MDHDRLFKELLTTFFAEFLDLFLPDISAYLDRNSLEFLDKEVFTDVTAGDKHETDLLVKARFRDQDAFFLVHVEHQSTPQAEFGKRMFRYFARLFEKHDLLVYPVVLFSYERPYRAEPNRFRLAFPGFTVNDFTYRVIQLNRLNWRDYMRQPNPVASALMAKMKIAVRERPYVKLECLRLLATLHLNPAKMQLISGFVDSYLELNAAEQRIFERELAAISPPEEEAIMEIMTSWKREGIAEGRQQGLQQGKQEGRQEGQAETILRLLHRRFGTLEVSVQKRIRELPMERLEELADALLDFTQAGDVSKWMEHHA